MSHETLIAALKRKDDEFYTQYKDICDGILPMMSLLEGKKILLPCDDKDSKFF